MMSESPEAYASIAPAVEKKVCVCVCVCVFVCVCVCEIKEIKPKFC